MKVEKFSQVGKQELKALCRQTSRKVHTAVWHCSATYPRMNVSVQDIDRMHRNRKNPFREIGYNLYITKDGKIWKGRNWNQIPAHVGGYNSNTLGFCYEGGIDDNGKPKDTRTQEQLIAMGEIVRTVHYEFRQKGVELKWAGHRDFSPDKDGDGVVEPWEWLKSCPCFSVNEWINTIL